MRKEESDMLQLRNILSLIIYELIIDHDPTQLEHELIIWERVLHRKNTWTTDYNIEKIFEAFKSLGIKDFRTVLLWQEDYDHVEWSKKVPYWNDFSNFLDDVCELFGDVVDDMNQPA